MIISAFAVAGFIAGGMVSGAPAPAPAVGQEGPVIELRFAQADPATGYVAVEPTYVDGPLFLSEDVIISDAHIDSVFVTYGRDAGVAITLILTEEGRLRLAQATRDNIGGRIALLLDSEPVWVSTVLDELSLGRVGVGSPSLPREAARQFGELVNARFPESRRYFRRPIESADPGPG
jgi:preprotein translocase subunit SecD